MTDTYDVIVLAGTAGINAAPANAERIDILSPVGSCDG